MGFKILHRSPLYKKEVVLEINDTEEIPEVIFPINLKFIEQYQRKYSSLLAKYI